MFRTLKPSDYPKVRIEADAERVVKELKDKPGKDIAIFGGGELFRSLLAVGLVDRLEMSVIPVLLGGGIPLLPPPAGRVTLTLRNQRLYKKTGTLGLETRSQNLGSDPFDSLLRRRFLRVVDVFQVLAGVTYERLVGQFDRVLSLALAFQVHGILDGPTARQLHRLRIE